MTLTCMEDTQANASKQSLAYKRLREQTGFWTVNYLTCIYSTVSPLLHAASLLLCRPCPCLPAEKHAHMLASLSCHLIWQSNAHQLPDPDLSLSEIAIAEAPPRGTLQAWQAAGTGLQPCWQQRVGTPMPCFLCPCLTPEPSKPDSKVSTLCTS